MARLLAFLAGLAGVPGPAAALQLPALVRESRAPVLPDGSPANTIVWAGDSLLGLADQGEQQIVLFDIHTGRHRRAGRPGEGPAEYRGVTPPLPGPDRSWVVVDVRLRRATVLDPSLGFRRAVAIPVVLNTVLEWRSGGLFSTWYDVARRMTPVLGTLRFSDADRAEPVPLVRLDSLFGSPARPPFSLPPIVAAAPGAGGHVYVGKVDEYRILKLDERGRPVRVYHRPELPVLRFSSSEIAEQTGRLGGAGPAAVSGPALARVREMLSGMAKPFFALTGLSEDSSGRLWVVTARSDQVATEIDVFSPEGRFLGTVKLSGQVRALAWRGNRVAALVERAEGEELLGAVDFYRIR